MPNTMLLPKILKIAVCFFADAQLLDYSGPLDLLGFLNASNSIIKPEPSHLFQFTHIGPEELIAPSAGPRARMDTTYAKLLEGDEQFDVLLVPGGWGTSPSRTPPDLIRFLQVQAPGAKYVMSVCTGAWILARAGLLDGRKATTNKSLFDVVSSRSNSTSIEWVHKARWVVDGNVWTSSGVTSGLDMAYAWLSELVGADVAEQVTGIIEHTPLAQDDDAWADYWTHEKQKILAEQVADLLV